MKICDILKEKIRMTKKIKLLVLDISNAGVGKFRFTDPHIMLQKKFKEEFHIDIMSNPPLQDKNFYSQYDGVFCQASHLVKDNIFEVFELLKKEGLKIIVDIDDYWRLPTSHAMFRRMEKQWKVLTSRMKIADMITCTTKPLAKKILRYNKNVAVIPNAINPADPQFIPNPIESNRTRIGWVGGSSHLEDLKLLRGIHSRLQGIDIKTQMVMCGFNDKSRDINTGEITTVKRPEVWMKCESVFTHNYNVGEAYQHYLLHPRREPFPNIDDQSYRRIWTKDISQYGTCYNHIDIALAPLVASEFNNMKSQLKVLEAGFHKKPLILSQASPYEIDCIHEKNCMMIPEKKAKKLWWKNIKKVVESPQMQLDLGEALYETVKDKYDLRRVSNFRRQVYLKVFS